MVNISIKNLNKDKLLKLIFNDKNIKDAKFYRVIALKKHIDKIRKHMCNFKKDLHSLRGLIILNRKFDKELKYIYKKYF